MGEGYWVRVASGLCLCICDGFVNFRWEGVKGSPDRVLVFSPDEAEGIAVKLREAAAEIRKSGKVPRKDNKPRIVAFEEDTEATAPPPKPVAKPIPAAPPAAVAAPKPPPSKRDKREVELF